MPGKPSDTSFSRLARSQPGLRGLPFAGRGSIRARQCSRFSRARRCLPPEKSVARDPCELVQWSAALAGRRGEPLHVFTGLFESSKASKAPTRPAGAPLSRAFRGPHALLRLLQMKCFHEHDDGPLEHPRPPNRGWDGCRSMTKETFASEGDRRGYAGPGVENLPNLDIPRSDCSPRRLCPNPDRSGHLVSRSTVFCPVRRDVGKKRARRRRVCLHRRCDERVVRRPVSAKKPDVHQPEVPSIARPSPEGRRREPRRCSAALRPPTGAFFTSPGTARGTLARDWVARSFDR